jgi:hypothetical protein
LQWFSVLVQVFLQVFPTHVSSVLFVFFLNIATVAAACLKSRSGVTHEKRVESSWRRGQRGPVVGPLARKPDALGCSLDR